MMGRHGRRTWVLAAAMVAAWVAPAAANGDAGELARELAKLRADVERLSGDIERHKDESRARLRTLTAQRADLELELQRETLRVEHVTAAIGKERARIQAAAEAQAALVPVARELVAGLRRWVEAAMPYRKAERLEAADALAGKLERGELKPAQVVARWWEAVEDELRIARESALDRQVVTLDGPSGPEERLVDVLHLGMVGMVFRAPGDDPRHDRYGRLVRQGAGWGWETFEGEADRQQVAALFDAFDKRIRVGFFELPNVLLAPATEATR